MLGYCQHCKQLVKVNPGRLLNERARNYEYKPQTHPEPNRHAGCGGVVYALDDCSACEKCELEVEPAQIVRGAAICPGTFRGIDT